MERRQGGIYDCGDARLNLSGWRLAIGLHQCSLSLVQQAISWSQGRMTAAPARKRIVCWQRMIRLRLSCSTRVSAPSPLGAVDRTALSVHLRRLPRSEGGTPVAGYLHQGNDQLGVSYPSNEKSL